MLNREDDITRLFERSFLGLLSEDEQKRLDEWLSESDSHRLCYAEMQTKGFLKKEIDRLSQINAELSYQQFMRKQWRKRLWRYGRYAAVVLPIGLAFALYLQFVSVRTEEVGIPVQTMTIAPGMAKAELILDDGTKVNLGDQEKKLQESNVQILASIHKLEYAKDVKVDEIKYNTLLVPKGGEFMLTLGDGTVVHLNADSKLRYPVQFDGNNREVFLEGEAFFDVTKQAGSTFFVHTKKGRIAVLGTSFNVRAYGDEVDEATTLVTGKVKIRTKEDQEIVIVPGEQCRLDDAGGLTKREVDVYSYIAWKDGIFAFDKQSLEEVMRAIGRWYDIETSFESERLKKILISGKMKRFSDFREVMKLIEMTGDLTFEIKGHEVVIKKKNV